MVCDCLTMRLAQTSGSQHYVTMVTKPPKPPCWRDFVAQNKSRASKVTTFTDITPPSASRLVTCPEQQQQQQQQPQQKQPQQQQQVPTGNEPTHAHWTAQHTHAHVHAHASRRHRKRLHRTRSEMSIEQREIPEVNRAVTLAETRPREFGLRRTTQFDAHVYAAENRWRCERWIEQVRASRPLEDVHFARGSGIELDIPDEEFGTRLEHSAGGARVAGSAGDPLADVIIPSTDEVEARTCGPPARNAPDDATCLESESGSRRSWSSGSIVPPDAQRDATPPGGREYKKESFAR